MVRVRVRARVRGRARVRARVRVRVRARVSTNQGVLTRLGLRKKFRDRTGNIYLLTAQTLMALASTIFIVDPCIDI